ncbi:MAG: YdeI/OmpD-associated family protein [Candidatus Limiplasma sp.]|nr:YdeI/OmpD-associated family protein [Candidatus Limiplasma sp.]
MKTDVPELSFATRQDFRNWLSENAATSGGVWLLIGKTKAAGTLTARAALEEALCFGWIDGQMKRVDDTMYRKYFACRQAKSPWSDPNKKIIESLRQQNRMTPLGEKAVASAKENGMWDASPSGAVTDDQIAAFADRLSGFALAHQHFTGMPRSARVAYVRRYLSIKKEETRQKDFEKIVALLQQNQKPTIQGKE